MELYLIRCEVRHRHADPKTPMRLEIRVCGEDHRDDGA